MTTLILLLTLLQDVDSLKAGLRPEEPAFTPQTERLQAVASLSAQLRAEEPPQPEYYVVVFSSPGCVPCRQFAASEDMQRIRSRYTVRTVDVSIDTRWGIDRIPSVWLCRTVTTRREQGIVVHRWRGRVTVDELRARE